LRGSVFVTLDRRFSRAFRFLLRSDNEHWAGRTLYQGLQRRAGRQAGETVMLTVTDDNDVSVPDPRVSLTEWQLELQPEMPPANGTIASGQIPEPPRGRALKQSTASGIGRGGTQASFKDSEL
jgi:hypothetical protein